MKSFNFRFWILNCGFRIKVLGTPRPLQSKIQNPKSKIIILLLCCILLIFSVSPSGALGWKGKSESEAFENGIGALREAKPADAPAARAALEALVAKYPENDLADNALLEIGRSYLAEEQYAEAAKRFELILKNYPQGDMRYEARYLLGLSYYRLGKMEEAVSVLNKVIPREPHYIESSLIYIRACLKLGKTADAIDRYSQVRKLIGDSAQAQELDAAVREAVSGLSEAKLEELTRSVSETPAGKYAMFLLGEKAYAAGQFKKARELFTKFLAQHANDPMAKEVRASLEEIDRIQSVNRNAIGIVLPLSGKWAAFGQRFLYGAALALGAFHPLPESRFPFELYVADSQSDPETARRAVEELCIEKRVIAIIGPVQSDEAAAAAKEAQSCGVPIVTLTQAEEVTQVGNMVFRNFVTPRDQTRALAWYAVTALGIKTFAILYPDHSYGQLFKRVFQEEVKKKGGEIVIAQAYQPNQADFRQEIKTIAQQKRAIQALFIPDSYYTAASIGPQLKFYNVVRIQLLGSSGWDSPKLIELVQPQTSSIEGAIFTDGFFPQSPEPLVRDFVRSFNSTFGYDPEIYEATSYETGRIIASIITEQRVADRLRMRDALATLTNFPSFSGYVQAQPDRSFRRPLFILQVREGRITDISTTAHF